LAIIAGVATVTAVGIASAHHSPGARSASSPLTWHKAAQRARFRVYRPHETLGLKLSGLFISHGCLLAGWGTRKGPHFGLYEPGNSVQCGQPGEATAVARTVINGVHVHVLVQCPTLPKCTARDGERKGELLLFVPERGPGHYSIQLQSMHVALGHFLKVARSFQRVR
jgi:hypothetical protein